jgi:hypothetical protein
LVAGWESVDYIYIYLFIYRVFPSPATSPWRWRQQSPPKHYSASQLRRPGCLHCLHTLTKNIYMR